MTYNVTIGIEIHVALNTKTKMFSRGQVNFDAPVNSNVNLVDLAFPGTLPSLNKEAVRSALKVALALNMEIETLLRFDRKNYFYSDLPKGYQITQQFYPLGQNGSIDIALENSSKRIGITRLHMEEDTAKQIHLDQYTLIDFNRAGVPLLEIVSEPDIHSAQEAMAYVSALREVLLYLGVSDVKMEEGSMRCDVNISLAKENQPLGTKVEIKNLNSLNNISRAIEEEISRQSRLLEAQQPVIQETRRFDETKRTTVSMRAKEGAMDYRYFPEPNILPVQLEQSWIDEIKHHLPRLASQRRASYQQDYQLEPQTIDVLLSRKDISDYFEQVMTYAKNPRTVANLILTDVLSLETKDSYDAMINPEYLAQLAQLLDDKTISSKQGKLVFEDVLNQISPQESIEKRQLKQESDPQILQDLIQQILNDHPQVIVDFKAGKDNSIKFVMGQVMKLTKGQANPALANRLVKEILESK